MGVVIATLVFLYSPPKDNGTESLLKLRHLGMYGATLAIITGIILALRYKISIIGNWLFDAKLLLILADGLIAEWVISARLKAGGEKSVKSLLLWAWLSLLIVIAIVVISVYRAKLRG